MKRKTYTSTKCFNRLKCYQLFVSVVRRANRRAIDVDFEVVLVCYYLRICSAICHSILFAFVVVNSSYTLNICMFIYNFIKQTCTHKTVCVLLLLLFCLSCLFIYLTNVTTLNQHRAWCYLD